MTRRGGFSRRSAQRIARTVLAFEHGGRDLSAVHFRGGQGDDEPLRLCKTTAAWAKNTLATLQVWEDGTPPNEAQTTGVTIADVVNKFADIESGKFVSIALHANGYWYVIAAEC